MEEFLVDFAVVESYGDGEPSDEILALCDGSMRPVKEKQLYKTYMKICPEGRIRELNRFFKIIGL